MADAKNNDMGWSNEEINNELRSWGKGRGEVVKPNSNKVFMHMPGETVFWNCPVLKALKKMGWKNKDYWTATEWCQAQNSFLGCVDLFWSADASVPVSFGFPNVKLTNHYDGAVYLCNKLSIGWCLNQCAESAAYFFPRQYSLCNQDSFNAFLQDFNTSWHDSQMYTSKQGVVSRKRNFAELEENPQEACRGPANAWVIKGIDGGWWGNNGLAVSVYTSLPPILCECQVYQWECVAQKYLEQPLLVPEAPGLPATNKIELRLWVLILDTNPMIVFAHQEPYFRIATRPYKFDDSMVQNEFAHKTNCRDRDNRYSFQQGLLNAGSQFESIWTNRIWPMLLDAVRATMISTSGLSFGPVVDGQPRKAHPNTFELVGFDFALDSEYRPWLLEVNKSPSMLDDCKQPELLRWAEDATEAMLKMSVEYYEGTFFIPTPEELELRDVPESLNMGRLFPASMLEENTPAHSVSYGKEAMKVPPCLVSGLPLDGPCHGWVLAMRTAERDVEELKQRSTEAWKRWQADFPTFKWAGSNGN